MFGLIFTVHSVKSALGVTLSAVTFSYLPVSWLYRWRVSYTAAISTKPVERCPVDTIESRPAGSRNSPKVSVPPGWGGSVVVVAAAALVLFPPLLLLEL